MALQALNTQVESLISTIGDVATKVNHGIQGWLKNSGITWISTAVAYYGVKFAKGNQWNHGMDEIPTAKFVALACSLYSVAHGVFESRQAINLERLKSRNVIVFTNAAALSLYAAHRLNINVPPFKAALVTGTIYCVVKMGHKILFSTNQSSCNEKS